MKYSKETTEKICKYLAMGMTIDQACRLSDLNQNTYHVWKKSKPEFCEAIKKARDSGEVANLAYIMNARPKNWTAAAWLLERQHPDRYGIRQDIKLTGGLKNENTNVLDEMDKKAMEYLEAKLDAVLRGNKSK